MEGGTFARKGLRRGGRRPRLHDDLSLHDDLRAVGRSFLGLDLGRHVDGLARAMSQPNSNCRGIPQKLPAVGLMHS